MAQVIMCDSQDGNAAVFLVTNLDAGDTAAWCLGCMPTFAQQIIAAFTPADTPPADVTPAGAADSPLGEAGDQVPAAPAPAPKSGSDETPAEQVADASAAPPAAANE